MQTSAPKVSTGITFHFHCIPLLSALSLVPTLHCCWRAPCCLLVSGFIEPWNYRTVLWQEGIRTIQFQPLCSGQGHLSLDQKSPSSILALNTFRNEAPTGSLVSFLTCSPNPCSDQAVLPSNRHSAPSLKQPFQSRANPPCISALSLLSNPSRRVRTPAMGADRLHPSANCSIHWLLNNVFPGIEKPRAKPTQGSDQPLTKPPCKLPDAYLTSEFLSQIPAWHQEC